MNRIEIIKIFHLAIQKLPDFFRNNQVLYYSLPGIKDNWTKQYPSTPYIWKDDGIKTAYMDWKLGEYFEVQYAGVDCLLIDMNIFKKIKKPYFSTNWSYVKETPPMSHITEDFYFYESRDFILLK